MKNRKLSGATEMVELLVNVSRHTKVHKGGRRFSFSALVVVGNQKGTIGYGYGKASEVIEAKGKAIAEAKRNMITIHLKENRTIYHDVIGQFCAGKVLLRSAPKGKGVVAGGPLRHIFQALGITDIVAKSLKSRNPKNMLRATFAALQKIESPSTIQKKTQ